MKFIKNKLAVTVIVLSVSFLILIGYSVKRKNGTFVENGVGITLNSVQGVIYNSFSKAKDSVGFIINFSKVKKENEELKKKNAELESKVLDYDRLNEQNKTFQAQLNFKDQRSEYNYMSCSVIGKTGNDILNGFVINRGKKDGVAVGMPIITPEGLVGIVTLTYDNYSQVQSIANENVAVAALVPRTNENTGYVKGFRDNENKMLSKLYNLPGNSSIQKGDAVVTSGTGRAYPPGIRIGFVIDIEDDKAKVAKNAIIEPYVNFDKLQEVLVVIPKTKGEIKY